ncbi:uncharacterized protein LOC128143763 [Harpia harpyja]|uniref:uncharacterized protein LOC128143763 n=1 Tax=Harpia harpyja TaxID=202280 RepID=UPI0022B0ADFF|nr:uncharacterized protein LOC128143763 [Harpia harpyja]
MEGCCTVAISSDLSFLFPTLLQLSTKGEGFGSSFPRGHIGAVRSQELQLLGCGGGGTGGVWELSEQWDEVEHLRSGYRDRVQKAQAEWATWEAWSAGEHRQPPKELSTSGLWAPHPPAQSGGKEDKEDKKRWRKAENALPEEEMASAAQLKRLQPGNLSPRATQVLKRLEPHQARRDIFKHVVETNRQKLEQQRQLPCARCSSGNRGEGARSSSCSSGAASKGAGRLPSCQSPPKKAK